MGTYDTLLHPETIQRLRLTGRYIARKLEARGREVAQLTKGMTDPPITVLIRTRNNEAYLPTLLEDIRRQHYDGRVELVVVDTESTDKTLEYAREAGAKIVPMKQAEFSYPKSLNVGFEAASSPYVMTLVGHCNLVSRYTFKAMTLWSQQPDLGGIYSVNLPNWNASHAERAFSEFFCVRFMNPVVETKIRMGQMGANASIVSRQVWQELGGYDEAYGAGGEDGALARSMLEHGKVIVREPLALVHHSHGLGVRSLWRQYRYWQSIYYPLPFDAPTLLRYRKKI